MLQFLKKLKLHTKLVPEIVHYVKQVNFLGLWERQQRKIGTIGGQNKNYII